MPMSAPAAKERRLLAQRSKRRMAPEIKAASPKTMVKGKRSWLELVRARVWMGYRKTEYAFGGGQDGKKWEYGSDAEDFSEGGCYH